ncbi:MAG: adenylate cyclase regulatory domain-containing protein, partial [Actinomycetota bacterium]
MTDAGASPPSDPQFGPPPSETEYESAGLFEDVSTDHDDRRALLDWLHEMGLSVDDMRDAKDSLALGAVAGDRQLVPGERLTLTAASQRTGVEPELLKRLATALGLLPIGGAPEGEVGLTADEADSLAGLYALSDLFSEDQALAFLRVLGSATARIGETAVSMFLADIESPLVLGGKSEILLATTTSVATRRVDGPAERLDPFLRRQILQAIERTRVTMIHE